MPFCTRFQTADFRRLASPESRGLEAGRCSSIATWAWAAVSVRSASVWRTRAPRSVGANVSVSGRPYARKLLMRVASRLISSRSTSMRAPYSAAAASSFGRWRRRRTSSPSDSAFRGFLISWARPEARWPISAHLELLSLPQLLRHVIEGGGQPPDLVVAVDRHGHVEPSLGHLRRTVGELVEGARRVAREDEHDREAEREDAEEREEALPEVVRELGADVFEVVGDLHVPAEVAVDDDRHDEAAIRGPRADEAGDDDVLRHLGSFGFLFRVCGGRRLGEDRLAALVHDLDAAQAAHAERRRVVGEHLRIFPAFGADLRLAHLDRLRDHLVRGVRLLHGLVARLQIDERLRDRRENEDRRPRHAQARGEPDSPDAVAADHGRLIAR